MKNIYEIKSNLYIIIAETIFNYFYQKDLNEFRAHIAFCLQM